MTGIPEGLCQCGCGAQTAPAHQTDRSRGYIKGQPRRFLPGHNRRKNPMMGADNPRWAGGRRTDGNGYAYLLRPEHPNANRHGYVAEHVLRASEALGKGIPAGVVVHHVNGDTGDNRAENLVICEDQAYHMLLEQRGRALEACGNPGWLKCRFCKQYDDPDNLYIEPDSGRGRHVSCFTEYNRARRAPA